MTTAIKIRPVRSGDWAQFENLIAGICRYHGDTHGLTRVQFDKMAVGMNAPVTTLVAETTDGTLAGFVAGFTVFHFHQGERCFEIQNLYVAENFRRQRIGEVLMLNIIDTAKHKHGAAKFKIGALNWNETAVQFYKQLGFNENTHSKDTIRLTKEVA